MAPPSSTPADLHIANDLALPEASVSSTFAILGDRGSGKSSTAIVLAEEMHRVGARWYAVDPTGAWWGITREGRGPGLANVFVLGGRHGDAPLEPSMGRFVAGLVVGSTESFVLDVSSMRKGQRNTFLADFAEELYHRNLEPLHGFWDEADRSAPQQVTGGGDLLRLTGALDDIVRLGRIRGLGATLITQRPQTLSKSVLEECQTLVAHRMTGPLKRKAVATWVQAQGDPEREREVLADLASLAAGEAIWWSPQFLERFDRIRVREKYSLDSSQTPTASSVAQQHAARRAPVDLELVRRQMADAATTSKGAPATDRGPGDAAALRTRIEVLETELERAHLEVREVPVVDEQTRSALQDATATYREASDALRLALDAVAAAVKDGAASPPAVVPPGPPVDPPAAPQRPRAPGQSAPAPRRSTGALDVRILEALAQLHPHALTPRQIGVLTGSKPSGGHFRNVMGALRTAGEISGSQVIALTDDGRRRIGEVQPLQGGEIFALWRSKLTGKAGEVLDLLRDGKPRTDREIADDLGVAADGGHFRNTMGKLRGAGVVERDAAKRNALAELL